MLCKLWKEQRLTIRAHTALAQNCELEGCLIEFKCKLLRCKHDEMVLGSQVVIAARY